MSNAAAPNSLAEIVHRHSIDYGDSIAYTFLADGAADAHSITWSQLDRRAGALGALLQEQRAAGERVLLTLPSGLLFVESLFACWYAGAIAVPVSLPRHRRVKHRLHGIIADADPRFAIGAADMRERIDAANLTWIDPAAARDSQMTTFHANDQRIAMLQYTSGSTGAPRGVIVSHSNLMCNSALIAMACGHRAGETIGGWLPLFHDMGLIGLVVQAAYSGARCVFMPPERFLMRPWLWLQMISDYGVCSSPAPNFAYDLCVERTGPEHKARMNLSGWRNALNGSEAVRPATLDRFAAAFAPCGFRRDAFFPCYGLAEATLFVTGPGEVRRLTRRTTDGTLVTDNDAVGHVGCGHAFGDTHLAIVNPETARIAPAGTIGEIWVTGQSVAQGYWKNPDATAATFDVHLDDRSWLRTGDLGFIADGELFITGRLRELIIIAGRNLFPIDLERTVESSDRAIAPSGVAAFSVESGGSERLIIVAEVRRDLGRPRAEMPADFDPQTVVRHVRTAIAAEHEVVAHDVVLLRPGALPRTTSGKISRGPTRDAYLNQTLDRVAEFPYVHATG